MLQEIQSRYTKESSNSCNLSCGNNLDFLKITQGEFILDLGCGRGHETIQAASKTGNSGRVVGLDLTQAMIEVAKENAVNLGISNVAFIKGDIEKWEII